jgi:hypothetical protein
LCGYLSLLTTATSGFKIISGSQNQRFWFFEKIRTKEPSILVISKTLKNQWYSERSSNELMVLWL